MSGTRYSLCSRASEADSSIFLVRFRHIKELRTGKLQYHWTYSFYKRIFVH